MLVSASNREDSQKGRHGRSPQAGPGPLPGEAAARQLRRGGAGPATALGQPAEVAVPLPRLRRRQARLANAMTSKGLWPADSPWVRPAMRALPRHAFAPDRLRAWTGHAYEPVDRAASPGRWAGLVYGGPYDSTVIQVTDGLPTSSLSCEAVVADMLDSLMLELGHAVLELGAATGRNAALMAHGVGPDGRVTTIEADPRLSDLARRNVFAAGARVTVLTGDGTRGAPAHGRFDRVGHGHLRRRPRPLGLGRADATRRPDRGPVGAARSHRPDRRRRRPLGERLDAGAGDLHAQSRNGPGPAVGDGQGSRPAGRGDPDGTGRPGLTAH